MFDWKQAANLYTPYEQATLVNVNITQSNVFIRIVIQIWEMPGALAFATAILIHHMCISSSHIHTHSPGFQNKPKYYWPISKAGKMIIVTSRWHCATSSHMHTTVCHKTLAYLKYAWIDALSFCKFVFPFQYNPGVCFPFNINLEPQQVIYISIVKVIWTDFYSSFLLCIILLYYTFYYVWNEKQTVQ